LGGHCPTGYDTPRRPTSSSEFCISLKLYTCSSIRTVASDIIDVWASDPLFYPARPPAHWLMCAEVAGRVLVVPLAPSRTGDPRRCRPIGCYEAAPGLATRYRRDPMTTPVTPDEEYDFYAKPENQEPQGSPRRRRASRLTSMVPVRFPPEMLDEIRRRAEAEHRSVSSWIRCAAERELRDSA